MLPLDFEESFDSLRHDFRAKELNIDDLNYGWECYDSLMWWLKGDIHVYPEGANVYPEERYEVIPETLKERLRRFAQTCFARIKGKHPLPYFWVEALVNDTGEVLSVYFRVDTSMIEMVKEEELLAIQNMVMREKLNVDNYDFSSYTNAQKREILSTIKKFIKEKTPPEERLQYQQEMEHERVAAKYGVLTYCVLNCVPGDVGIDSSEGEWGEDGVWRVKRKN